MIEDGEPVEKIARYTNLDRRIIERFMRENKLVVDDGDK